jgi:AraC-like DNA-binding protein
MRLSRSPRPALRPFIQTLWAHESHGGAGGARERVLPTGTMHLVFRITDTPLLLLEGPRQTVRSVGCAVIGGARSTFYERDVSQATRSVGAQLLPGAGALLLGVPAGALAEGHTNLEDLWGRGAAEARARIAAADSLECQLDTFEEILCARLPKVRALHPAVAEALERLRLVPDVGAAVERSGYSHRHFIRLFRDAVGLSPKIFTRVARFQRALALARQDLSPARPGETNRTAASWAEIALAAGYSDQPHLYRDFHDFAGISPGRHEKLAGASPNHVPLGR